MSTKINIENYEQLLTILDGYDNEAYRIFQKLKEADLKDKTKILQYGKHASIERVEWDYSDKKDICIRYYDAGYDIKNNLDGVLEQFDKIIGLDRLKACHLNDSKNPFESHKDRHEKIGQGSLGIETFEKVINHPALRDLPFILETPQESTAGYAEEIRLLRGLYRD